jgi:hypothetical protein
MKNLFYTLIAAILLISCSNAEKKTETASTDVKQADRIEVLYFHGLSDV